MDFSSFFNDIVKGLSVKLEQKVTGRRIVAYHTARLGARIFSGKEPVVWVNVTVPFEIINSFPVASIYSEFVGAVLAGADMAGPFIERAETAGFATDLCSYHRSLLGAMLDNIIPKPVAAIACSYPCDGGLKSVGEIGRMAQAPFLTIQVPEKNTDENVDYLARQFEGMTDFLARITGHPFDRDRFRSIIEKSNEASAKLAQLYGYARLVPAPYSHKDLKNFQIVMMPLVGTDEGIQIADTFLAEFEQRVARGETGLPDEKLRLLWIQNRIQFPNNLLDYLADQFGANIVWDELNEIFWEPIDPDDPFRGLARRLIDSPLSGDLQKRIDTLAKRAVDYKIDGAINPGHWGCRQSLNARTLFARALDKVGVPMISLDVDCVDKRSFAPGQIITRLEAFCEMLK